MGLKLQKRVWASHLTPSPLKFTLLAIADNANDSTAEAWPAIATTAKRCSLSVKQARRHVRTLVELGYLVELGPRLSGAICYRIAADKLAAVPNDGASTPADGSPAHSHAREGAPPIQGSSPLPSAGVAPSHVRETNPNTTQSEPKVNLWGVVGGAPEGADLGLTARSALPAPSMVVAAPKGIAPDTWVQIAERKARPFTARQLATLAAQVDSAIAAGESVRDVEARLASLLTPERAHWVGLPRAETPTDRAIPSPPIKKRATGRKKATAAPIGNPDTRASSQDWTYDPSEF